MDLSEAKRLRSVEDENAKLKRLLADAMLDNVALKDSGAVFLSGRRLRGVERWLVYRLSQYSFHKLGWGRHVPNDLI